MSTNDDLRRIALSMPGAYEEPHFGSPSYRVAKKLFVTTAPELNRATLKLDEGHREMLIDVRPEAFSRCVWGKIVRLCVQLDQVENDELEGLVRRSWEQVAPKSLTKA